VNVLALCCPTVRGAQDLGRLLPFPGQLCSAHPVHGGVHRRAGVSRSSVAQRLPLHQAYKAARDTLCCCAAWGKVACLRRRVLKVRVRARGSIHLGLGFATLLGCTYCVRKH
jgi:hypothetical protein